MTTLLTRAPAPAPAPAQRAAPATPATAPAPPPTAGHRLVLTGTLTRADTDWLAPELERLVATGSGTVEVDLSRVEHLDAAVARLLLRTSWHLGDPARELVLLRPAPQPRRVLRFVGAGGLVVR